MTKTPKNSIITLITISTLFSLPALAKKPKTSVEKSTPVKQSSETISNHWYTMQAGSTPWGYFHEVIEKKEGRYFYRYEMSKRENGNVYQETMGAVAEDDLTPIAFNLTKSGEGSTEVVNGSYSKDGSSPYFLVDVSGGRKFQVKRHISKKTILEVMFPIFLSKEWPQFKPGFKGTTSVFTEDASNSDYISRSVHYSVRGPSKNNNCTEIDIEMENTKSLWCMNSTGIVQFMNINNNQVQVNIAKSENEAKAFLDNSPKPVKTSEISTKPAKKAGH